MEDLLKAEHILTNVSDSVKGIKLATTARWCEEMDLVANSLAKNAHLNKLVVKVRWFPFIKLQSKQLKGIPLRMEEENFPLNCL